MKVLRLLNVSINQFLTANAAAKVLSEPTVILNKEGTYRRSQSLVELSNGKKYAISISPVGDSVPAVKP
jgi:hypothetical protein